MRPCVRVCRLRLLSAARLNQSPVRRQRQFSLSRLRRLKQPKNCRSQSRCVQTSTAFSSNSVTAFSSRYTLGVAQGDRLCIHDDALCIRHVLCWPCRLEAQRWHRISSGVEWVSWHWGHSRYDGYTHTHAHTHTHTCARWYKHTHRLTHAHVNACTHTRQPSRLTHGEETPQCMCMYAHVCVCVCVSRRVLCQVHSPCRGVRRASGCTTGHWAARRYAHTHTHTRTDTHRTLT